MRFLIPLLMSEIDELLGRIQVGQVLAQVNRSLRVASQNHAFVLPCTYRQGETDYTNVRNHLIKEVLTRPMTAI